MMMVFGFFVFELRPPPISNRSCPVTGGTSRIIEWAGAQNGSTLAPVRTG